MTKALRLMVLCSLACSMGCASLKDNARDAVAEAWTAIKPDLIATGKELANHSTTAAKDALKDFVSEAKGDIGGALASIPDIAKNAGASAGTEAIAKRLELDPELSGKAAEFRQRAEDEGLPAALEWLFGAGGLTITMGIARLWWRTRGALKVVAQGVESADAGAAAAVKAAVKKHGGASFDREIQSALKS